jgi:predicted DNA-binding protein
MKRKTLRHTVNISTETQEKLRIIKESQGIASKFLVDELVKKYFEEKEA